MSAVGRSCVNTIKRSRQNVAIATQVLSPSAIGGSLRGQRRLKHFGPPDDDEEEFITYRRRAAWKKLCYYGLAIGVTILVLMGTILAVGFLQTKSKSDEITAASRSIKLVQDTNPMSYIYTSKTTTPAPPSVEPTDSREFSPTLHSSFLRSYTKADSLAREGESSNQNDNYEEIHISSSSGESNAAGGADDNNDDYPGGYNLEDENSDNEGDKRNENFKNHHESLFVKSHPFHTVHDDNPDHHLDSSREFSSNKGDKDKLVDLSNPKLENDLGAAVLEKESVHNDVNNNNDDWKSKDIVDTTDDSYYDSKEKIDDESPTKEKISPPVDSVFSLEIPIYSQNKTRGEVEDSFDETEFAKESDPVTDPSVLSEDIKSENTTSGRTQDEALDDDDGHSHDATEQQRDNNKKSKLVDDKPFDVLHTSIFHLDDDSGKAKAKPGATAIIIEDRDYDELNSFGESTSLFENLKSDHLFTNQHGQRKHKVKIVKNDKVMNMKATYTPERVQQNFNRLQEPIHDRKIDVSKQNAQKHTIGIKSRNDNNNGARNGTSNEWKLRLRVNKDESAKVKVENLKDDSIEDISSLKYQDGVSSDEQIKSNLNRHFAKGNEPKAVYEEKPRSLSTSSFLPNFESFLKSILSNVQQASTKLNNREQSTQLPPSDFGTSYANNIDRFLPASTLASPTLEKESSHFRKRTFNSEHDLFDFPSSIHPPSPPQPDNYFNHLLEQYPTVGAIGSASATGASLSNLFQSPIYPTISSTLPYDINPASDNSQLAPGVVPLNLASSYIPVNLPKTQHFGQQQQSLTSPYGTHNFYDNYGDPTYSLPNVHLKPSGNSDIGTVTTAGGLPPTYNSISQGMHLLNLISGTIPSTYYHDQVFNPSTSHTTHTTPSSFQHDFLATTPPYQFNFNTSPTTANNLATSTNYIHNANAGNSNEYQKVVDLLQNTSPPTSFPVQSFDYHPEASNNGIVTKGRPSLSLPLLARALAIKSDREAVEKFLEEEEEDTDQEPAASTFSQSILTTLKKPKTDKKLVPQEQTTTAGSIVTLMTKPKARTTSMFKTTNHSFRTRPTPKSFSFEILPHKNPNPTSENYASPDFFDKNVLSLSNNDMYPSLNEVSASKTKKKSLDVINKPWNKYTGHNIPGVGADFNINHGEGKITPRKSKARALQKKIRNATNAAGLKSGFFT